MAKLTKAQQNVVADLAENVISNTLVVVQCLDRNTGELGEYLAKLDPAPEGGVQATPLAKMVENPFSHLEPTGEFCVLHLTGSE